MPRYGRLTKNKRKLRRKLFKHVRGKCPRCGVQMKLAHGARNSATLDHTKPKSLGGDDRNKNLSVMCLACNQAKGDKEISDEP